MTAFKVGTIVTLRKVDPEDEWKPWKYREYFGKKGCILGCVKGWNHYIHYKVLWQGEANWWLYYEDELKLVNERLGKITEGIVL